MRQRQLEAAAGDLTSALRDASDALASAVATSSVRLSELEDRLQSGARLDAAEQAELEEARLVMQGEVWLVPAGDFDVAGPLELGDSAVGLALRGGSDALHRITTRGGGLTLRGRSVDVEDLEVVGDAASVALQVEAGTIGIRRVVAGTVSSTDATAVLCIASQQVEILDTSISLTQATARSVGITIEAPQADVRNLSVGEVEGDEARGVEIYGEGTVSIVDVDVEPVRGTTAGLGVQVGALPGEARMTPRELKLAGVRLTAVNGDDAAGVVLMSSETLDLADLQLGEVVGGVAGQGLSAAGAQSLDVVGVRVDRISGGVASGVRLLSGGPVSALDLTVSDVSGVDAGQGLVVGAVASLRVSGVSITDVSGRHAIGALTFGGEQVEVGVGTITGVRGEGGSAVGLRVLPSPSEHAVRVVDFAVEAIWGATPLAVAQPDPAWETWRDVVVHDARLGVVAPTLPVIPDGVGVSGLHVGARVRPVDAVLRDGEPGGLHVGDCQVRRVSGVALQVEGDLRPASLDRVSAWTSNHLGWVQAEVLLLAQCTFHRHRHGLEIGPGEVRLYNVLLSAFEFTDALTVDPEAEMLEVASSFTDAGAAPLLALGPLPYRNPGPATFPAALGTGDFVPEALVDLRLDPSSVLVGRATAVPGGTEPFQVGAHPLEEPIRCETRDPQPFPWAEPTGVPAPDPVVDYLARDAPSLLALMLQRARVTMPSWQETGAADFTRMLFELLADRLDHASLRQEVAVEEGFLDRARLRRSVEDHARVLDYTPDPGLSATAMLRFRLDETALTALAAQLNDEGSVGLAGDVAELLSDDSDRVLIPADTLVGSPIADEGTAIFATEEDLAVIRSLDEVALVEDVPKGATSARLEGRLSALEAGRWLVFYRGPRHGGHVVRLVAVERLTHSTLIRWDPRRPTPQPFPADDPALPEGRTRVFGNVVPAHHGVPINHIGDDEATAASDSPLRRWRELLTLHPDGSAIQEIDLPLAPVSHLARGYPFPGEPPRVGEPQVRLAIEGDPWTRVDDLSTQGPGDEVFVLRASPRGGSAVRFGDGVGGQALPGRQTEVRLDLRIGQGTLGNVGAHVLDRLIQLGEGKAGSPDLQDWLAGRDDAADWLRRIVVVENPLAAVGGRDPEDIDVVRYRAPFTVRDAVSAVNADDYVRAVERLSEVVAARATVRTRGVRALVRTTVLLHDESVLDPDERLRRWAEVRRTLESVRLLGYDVEAVPPRFVPLDLDVVVDAEPHARTTIVRHAIVESIAGHGGLLDPNTSGLGGDVHLDRLYRRLTAVEGVKAARVRRFRRFGRSQPDHLHDGLIPIEADEVAVVRSPHRPESDGILTVTVCGGMR